jgi:membrane-associated phospholipid phosphatase
MSITSKIYTKLWGMKESFIDSLREVGDKLQIIIPVSFLIYSSWTGQERLSQVFIITFLITGAIQVILKAITSNPRPRELPEDNTENVPIKFGLSINHLDSWPSGHTMAAASGVFYFEISKLAGVIAVFFILVVVLSRIASKSHFIRDCVTSGAIYTICYYIAHTYYL